MNANELESGPLAELLQSQKAAIAEFQRIESEKAGRDIDWEAAADRWFTECFADWVREERRAIDQVLAAAVPITAARKNPPLRQTALQPVLVPS